MLKFESEALIRRLQVAPPVTHLIFAIMLLVFSADIRAEEVGRVYIPEERRDPFVPLVTADGKIVASFRNVGVVVEGIIFDPTQGSMVLINGEFYREGDTIEEANIISIFKDRVILSHEDGEKTIWIHEEVLDETK